MDKLFLTSENDCRFQLLQILFFSFIFGVNTMKLFYNTFSIEMTKSDPVNPPSVVHYSHPYAWWMLVLEGFSNVDRVGSKLQL